MVKKAPLIFVAATAISFLLVTAIPILHVIYRRDDLARKKNLIKPKRIELYNQNRKKKKKTKTLKKITPKRLSRSRRAPSSRFQMDLNVGGPADGVIVRKKELKVEAYEMGQTDTPPILRRQPRPVMPLRAQEEQVEGKVTVRFLVDEKGNVKQRKLLKEDPAGYGFGIKAIEAIKKYEFEPAMLRGIPVKIWVVQEMEFLLND